MSTLSNKIRAMDPLLPPWVVAGALKCCPRYVVQVRWRDRARERRERHKAKARQDAVGAYVLEAGDPRRAAWLAYWLRDPQRATYARQALGRKAPITVNTNWPPESPEVEVLHGLFYIPPGTPEYASHIALLRKRGLYSLAQSIEFAKKQITPKVRWGTEEALP